MSIGAYKYYRARLQLANPIIACATSEPPEVNVNNNGRVTRNFFVFSKERFPFDIQIQIFGDWSLCTSSDRGGKSFFEPNVSPRKTDNAFSRYNVYVFMRPI